MARFVSTFLSYSSEDEPLVRKTAKELARRGIIPWLATNDSVLGASLTQTLREAIQRQETVVAFLSPTAVVSPWVDRELKFAMEQLEDRYRDGRTAILPVYLGDPMALVQKNERLKQRWLLPGDEGVDRLGISVKPDADLGSSAKRIADAVAERLYRDAGFGAAREVVLFLDQRNGGKRGGEPKLPEEWQRKDAPCLVLRSDIGQGSDGETLVGTEWQEFQDTVIAALNLALGGTGWGEQKEIYLTGRSQLALPFRIGRHFNRNTNATLYCCRPGAQVLSNAGQPRTESLLTGNPHCEERGDERFPPPPESGRVDELALAIVSAVARPGVHDYLAARYPALPRLLVTYPTSIDDSGQAMALIADVVALLKRYKDRDLQRIVLFTTLPFHVLPLLGANLRHVVGQVTFAEYRTDLNGEGERYAELAV